MVDIPVLLLYIEMAAAMEDLGHFGFVTLSFYLGQFEAHSVTKHMH